MGTWTTSGPSPCAATPAPPPAMSRSRLALLRCAIPFGGLAVAALLLGGCFGGDGYDGPTTREIEATFAAHRAAFEELDAMLRAERPCRVDDSGGQRYFTVSDDEICAFRESGRAWVRIDPSASARRADVLREAGLTEARYARYLDLLDEVDAEKATWSDDPWRPSQTALYLGGAGWVASSYYVRVVRQEAPPGLIVDDVFAHIEREGYGTYRVYSVLGDGWYVEMDMMW